MLASLWVVVIELAKLLYRLNERANPTVHSDLTHASPTAIEVHLDDIVVLVDAVQLAILLLGALFHGILVLAPLVVFLLVAALPGKSDAFP